MKRHTNSKRNIYFYFLSLCFNRRSSPNGLYVPKTKYPYKETVHTIASDNGSEFAEHQFIAKNQYKFLNSAHSFLAKQEKYTR
ncbi:hypothetical protein EZS27_017195 [termite gut metagenome]|uniref:Integrase catalytic domain-containing protein n=1 Tax=termite gut metagenome TaxID=433724 RepID=A0A5J4RLG8_9ZZZZ